jgi:acyl dehydratase
VDATGATTSKITAIADKSSAALVEVQATTVDASNGAPLFTNTSKLFFRGEGGWGGSRGSRERVDMPETEPDAIVSYNTRPDQALLYRLNGDRNPLHSDPGFATRAGFDRPILHGLCSFGFTGRALLHAVCDSDVSRFRAMSVRFSAPVFPGERLDIHIWHTGSETAMFRTLVGDRVVIDNGIFDHS